MLDGFEALAVITRLSPRRQYVLGCCVVDSFAHAAWPVGSGGAMPDDLGPVAQAFLADLAALCERYQVRLDLDWMYECVTLCPLQSGAAPFDAYFFEDALAEPHRHR